MFPHENFKPYQFGVEFLILVTQVCSEIPRGHGDLIDQLRRASTSIVLNIAEGTGRSSKPEMKRFYSIARGSALECVAILDVLLHLKLISPASRTTARTLLQSVVAILTSICYPVPN